MNMGALANGAASADALVSGVPIGAAFTARVVRAPRRAGLAGVSAGASVNASGAAAGMAVCAAAVAREVRRRVGAALVAGSAAGCALVVSSCVVRAAETVARRARVARGRGATLSLAVTSAAGVEEMTGACADVSAAGCAADLRVRVVRLVRLGGRRVS